GPELFGRRTAVHRRTPCIGALRRLSPARDASASLSTVVSQLVAFQLVAFRGAKGDQHQTETLPRRRIGCPANRAVLPRAAGKIRGREEKGSRDSRAPSSLPEGFRWRAAAKVVPALEPFLGRQVGHAAALLDTLAGHECRPCKPRASQKNRRTAVRFRGQGLND